MQRLTLPLLITYTFAYQLQHKPLILKNVKHVNGLNHDNPEIEWDDLHQEALFALFDAIRNFDPIKFPTIYFGHYLKIAIANKLKCYYRNFGPHKYIKDKEETELRGKPTFKRIAINVQSFGEEKDLELKITPPNAKKSKKGGIY